VTGVQTCALPIFANGGREIQKEKKYHICFLSLC